MSIKLSTILSSLFYLLPLYLFVFAPLLRQFFPEESSPLSPSTADYLFPNSANDQDADDLAPSQALNLVDDTFISIDDGITPECPLDPTYRIHFLSRTPLVIYIEGFLTTPEADHLVDIRYLFAFDPQVHTTPSLTFTEKRRKIHPQHNLQRHHRARRPLHAALRACPARP